MSTPAAEQIQIWMIPHFSCCDSQRPRRRDLMNQVKLLLLVEPYVAENMRHTE